LYDDVSYFTRQMSDLDTHRHMCAAHMKLLFDVSAYLTGHVDMAHSKPLTTEEVLGIEGVFEAEIAKVLGEAFDGRLTCSRVFVTNVREYKPAHKREHNYVKARENRNKP